MLQIILMSCQQWLQSVWGNNKYRFLQPPPPNLFISKLLPICKVSSTLLKSLPHFRPIYYEIPLANQYILQKQTLYKTYYNIHNLWTVKRLQYQGADKFLARPGQIEAQKHVRDMRDFNDIEKRAVIKFSPPARQGAEGNSCHSDKNISLLPSWSG